MTADSPTPTPPDRDPDAAPASSDPADAPTARYPPRPADPASPPPPTGLYRSTRDRMLAGVCGGIAERYGIDAVVVRLAFLASLLIGGAGVLFYVAAAIVIPNPPPDGDPDAVGGPPVATGVGNGILRILVALAVALAVCCGLGVVAGLTFAGTLLFGAWPAAISLIVMAAVLATVAGNRRSAAALLVLIVAVAAPAAAAMVADLSVDRSVGERTETPLHAAETTAGYRLGLGSLVVDLRRLRLMPGSTPMRVPVRVDIGRAAIVIPEDRCVAWTIRTRIGVGGDVSVLADRHETWAGYRHARTFRINPGGSDRRPRVTIDAHVGIGEIVVGHSLGDIDQPARGTSGTSTEIRTPACPRKARRP